VERRFEFEAPRVEGLGVILVAVLIIVGGIIIFSVGRIQVGYVAIVVDPIFGSTTSVGTGINAKYFLKMPWASVYKIYVATDSIHMWSDPFEQGDFPAVESLTKDGLKVDVDITVRWRLSPSATVALFRKFPSLDWRDRAIIPIIRESIRNLLVDFSAIETIEKRGTIGAVLFADLEESFNKELSIGDAIILDAVNIRKITLPDTFVNAIEKKLAAEQLAIAAEFNRTRLLVIADANAQASLIEAQGLANSRLVLANATRVSIELISESDPDLNAAEIAKLYLYLETLRDIAESGKGQFIIVPDESQYILPIQ
jgi:regulator of protease activity HflC (stomatin/prohibitin superfamily)